MGDYLYTGCYIVINFDPGSYNYLSMIMSYESMTWRRATEMEQEFYLMGKIRTPNLLEL